MKHDLEGLKAAMDRFDENELWMIVYAMNSTVITTGFLEETRINVQESFELNPGYCENEGKVNKAGMLSNLRDVDPLYGDLICAALISVLWVPEEHAREAYVKKLRSDPVNIVKAYLNLVDVPAWKSMSRCRSEEIEAFIKGVCPVEFFEWWTAPEDSATAV